MIFKTNNNNIITGDKNILFSKIIAHIVTSIINLTRIVK